MTFIYGFILYATFFQWQSQVSWLINTLKGQTPSEPYFVSPDDLLQAVNNPYSYATHIASLIPTKKSEISLVKIPAELTPLTSYTRNNFIQQLLANPENLHFLHFLAQNATILGQFIVNSTDDQPIVLLSASTIFALISEFLTSPQNIVDFIRVAFSFRSPQPVEQVWYTLHSSVKIQKISQYWVNISFLHFVNYTFDLTLDHLLPQFAKPETLIQVLYNITIYLHIANIVLQQHHIPIPNLIHPGFDSIYPKLKQSLSQPVDQNKLKTILSDSSHSIISLHNILDFLNKSLIS